MAGLLRAPGPTSGLLSKQVTPVAEEIQRAIAAGLLNPAQQAPAPTTPKRDRVSGWRVFDRVLGGQTVSEGLDAERARLQAEAQRPQMEAQRARLGEIARSMGPAAEAAYALNPEKFGESLSEQFAPQVINSGAVQSIAGTGAKTAANSFSTVNDTIYRNNPLTGASEIAATAPPAYSDKTARFNAENPVLSAGSTWVGLDGQPRGQGYIAPEVVSTPQGGSTNVFDAQGNLINTVQGNPDQPKSGAAGGSFDATTRGALQAARDTASMARSRAADARRFIELNKQAGTGVGAAILGPAAGLNPTYAEMRAISARLIPQERTPGSGPMSDKDIALYGRAVLDIDKPGPTNQAMANVVVAQAERDADYAAFLDEYATRNGNLNGAQEDWTAYANANPLFDERNGNTVVRPQVQPWRTFMGWGERQRGGSGGAQGGSGQPVRVNSPQEAQALPSGTLFTTPDGQTRRKR